MTEDELKAIEKRVNAATPGPWTTGAGKIQDRTFIAAARTDVPTLVAEVRRMRKEAIARGAMTCDQCGDVLTDETRHISGLMCIPCGLPVIDTTT
jgi:hypothetical protein